MTFHLSTSQEIIIGLVAVWDLAWRGFALWRAARKQQRTWYIALLIFNTVGLLPIIYLLSNREEASHDRASTTNI